MNTLTPVQDIVAKLILGLPLDGTEKFPVRSFEPQPGGHSWSIEGHTERSYVRKLYAEGRCNHPEGTEGLRIRETTLVAGRRSGKSTLAGSIATLEMLSHISCDSTMNPVGFHLVGNSPDQAKCLFQAVSEVVLLDPTLRRRKANDAVLHMSFQTDGDIKETGAWVGSQRRARASFHLRALSAHAPKKLQGHMSALLYVDEPDTMLEGQAEVVWKYGEPSTRTLAGKVLVAGSPTLPGYGWFRERFENEVKQKRGLALRIPTWEMNPHIPLSFLEEAYYKNPVEFFAEYGACFLEMVQRPVGVPEIRSTIRVGAAMSTLNEIGQKHREWQDKNFTDISVLTQGLCLAEECGEVARAIVKEHHGIRAHDRGNLADELADVILVATGLAARCGIDMDAALASKAARRDLKNFRERPETG